MKPSMKKSGRVVCKGLEEGKERNVIKCNLKTKQQENRKKKIKYVLKLGRTLIVLKQNLSLFPPSLVFH